MRSVDSAVTDTKFALHKLEKLIVARSEETRQRIDKLNSALCEFNEGYAKSFLLLYSRLLVDEAYSVVERARSGEIDPRMIPLEAINDMTSPGGPLMDTIYQTDPGLFYALTTPYLVGMDRKQGLLYYMLQTPVIVSDDISPSYKVFNFGYLDKATKLSYKLDLPEHFYMLSNPQSKDSVGSIPVPVDPLRCREHGPFIMCRHEVPEITNRSLCLQSLIQGTRTNVCHIIQQRSGHSHVLHPLEQQF